MELKSALSGATGADALCLASDGMGRTARSSQLQSRAEVVP